MYYNVESINLKSKYETEEVKEFLGKFNLKYEDVDYTVVIRENEEIIATCSKKENILKDIDLLKENNIEIPPIIEFIHYANKHKNIN